MNPNETQSFKQIVTRQYHSAKILHFYRLIIATLLIAQILLPQDPLLNIKNIDLFSWVSFFYLIISLFWLLISWQPTRNEEQLLSIQIYLDIIITITLMHASGGVESGLGILLIISIIMTSLLCTPTLTIIFAAVSTVGLLSEFLYNNFQNLGHATGSTQVGLLGMALFATAYVSIRYTKEIRAANKLAKKQREDLDNLAALNDFIIDNMESGIIALDTNFNVQHINQIAADLLNLPILLKTHLSRVHPNLWGVFKAWFYSTDPNVLNRRYLPTDSHIENVQIHFKHIINDQRYGFLIFLDDLSIIQKQANQTKFAALGHLTGNIAHEIRNPLSAISHATQLLGENTNKDTTDQRMTEIITKNVSRINHIIEDVLQISRRSKIVRQSIEIEDWLNHFIKDFCLGSTANLDCFKIEIQTQNSLILFDHGHLNQILTNICQNAKNHGDNKKPVHISTSKNKYQFIIEIADEGPGIPEKDLSKLIEPFYTTSLEGSGLGLYIVNELCQLNRAKLVISNNAYRGTSVQIKCELINE